jgi:hypothetical protein
MRQGDIRRLERIEAAISLPVRPARAFRTVIDDPDPDARAAEWQRDLIASGQAIEGDLFITRIIVRPGQAHAAAP